VGFLVTVPVPYRLRYSSEYRSPAELVLLYVRAAGPQWQSRLRMVIAVNRFNDPGRGQVQWVSEQGYGTTARLEAELDEAVAYWQAQADAVAPGIATVIGQVVEPPVWDDAGRLVDPDVLRHMISMRGAIRYTRRFPYAGARQAIVASDAALARLRELWRFNGEVWIHIGDADVLETTNPADGGGESLLQRYAGEIRQSTAEGPSQLVRLGGGYAFSPEELRDGPRGGLDPAGDSAVRLTLLLAEADNQQRALLSAGRWPRGYFSEQNTLLNSRYVDQVIGSMGQGTANRLGVPDLSLGLHARLGELGWLSDDRSRFLADQAARVVTSAHGRRTTVSPHDMRGVLRPRSDQGGQITGFDILRPGRTLREFGMLATHGYTRKDRNMVFREAQILRVGKALEQTAEGQLFDPDTRARALLRKLDRLQQAPAAEADRLRAQLLDTGPKAAEAAQLAAVMERVLSSEWNRPLEYQLGALSEYDREPLPDWYTAEFERRPEIDPTDTDLARALSQLSIPDHDITEILTAFTTLTIGPGSAAPAGGPPPAAGLAVGGAEGGGEIYAAMAAPAAPVTEVTSAEFGAAVAGLAAQLDLDQPSGWLQAAISYLVEHDWTEEVPAVDELPGILADLTGTPVEQVTPARVQHGLRQLAEAAAIEPGPDSPTEAQSRYLAGQGLGPQPVPVDGDSPFTAVAQTVPQPELLRLIHRAAWRWGIQVPAEDVGPVTGQHLRLFLAQLVELGFGGWPRARSFVPDGTDADDHGRPALTRLGLVTALRRLTDYGGPYGRLFPQLIAYFLDLPLQVLDEVGLPVRLPQQGAGAPYTIVQREHRYLATRPQAGRLGQDAGNTRPGPGSHRRRDINWDIPMARSAQGGQ
jgi:hypothetical protein